MISPQLPLVLRYTYVALVDEAVYARYATQPEHFDTSVLVFRLTLDEPIENDGTTSRYVLYVHSVHSIESLLPALFPDVRGWRRLETEQEKAQHGSSTFV